MGQTSPSFWLRRRVFVTGCTGFLGTWVVRELLAHGAVVIGLVRDRIRPSDLFDDRLFERITTVRGRVEDRWRLESALAVHGIETFFHLATPAIALATPTEPTRHLAARWTRTVLDAAQRAVPGAEVVIPIPMDDATGRAETAISFARQTGAAVGVAMLPRLFGGGDRTWSRLVPWTVQALLSGTAPEPLRQDERTEPYLYVQDAARACLWLAESLAGDPESWTGRTIPFPATATGAELFDALAAPYRPAPIHLKRFETDDAYTWRPFTPLLDAVAETVGWYGRFSRTSSQTPAAIPTRFAA